MSSPAQTPARNRARRRIAVWLLMPLAMLAAVVLASMWLVLSEAGLRTAASLAGRLSGGRVVAEAAAGRLAGPLRIARLHVRTPDLRVRMEGLALGWNPAALLQGRLDIVELSAERIDISVRPDDAPKNPVVPDALALPLSLALQSLRVGHFALREWTPEPQAEAATRFELSALSARADSDGRRHRIESLDVELPAGRVSLAGEIDGKTPFALSATGSLQGERDGRDYRLQVVAAGDLLAPRLRVEASGAGLSGDAEVLAAPFAPVPLRQLRVALGDIDPSAFQPQAPRAALRIEAELVVLADPVGTGWGLSGPVSIVNRTPATLDRNGLPFSRLSARLYWAPQRARAEGVVLELSGAGRVTGDLDWQAADTVVHESGDSAMVSTGAPAVDAVGRLSATLQVVAVALQRLDARLPRTTLGGRVTAAGDRERQTAEVDLQAGEARMRAQAVLTAQAPEGGRSLAAAGELVAVDPRAFVVDAPSARLNLDFRVAALLADVSRYDLSVNLRPSRLHGRPLHGSGRAVVEGRRLADALLDLTVAGNRVQARGAWGQAQDVLQIDVDAPALAALDAGFAGRARLNGTLSGTLEQPAGSLKLFAEALRLPGGVRVAGLNADGRLGAGMDGAVQLVVGLNGLGPVAAASGTTAGREAREPDWVAEAALTLGGTRRSHVLDLVASGFERDSVRLRLEGGVTAPEAAGADAGSERDGMGWQGRVMALETAGRWGARLTAPAALVLGRGRVELAPAVFDAGERGRIRLDETVWTSQRTVTRGSLTGLAFGLSARPEGARNGRQGTAGEGRLRRGPGPLLLGAEWDVNLGETAQGSVRVFREAGDLTVTGEIPARLGLQHFEARLAAQDNRLALAWEARGTELGELAGSVSALAERSANGGWRLAPDAALLGSARLTMPSLAWVGRLMQEHIVTGGRLEASFGLAGTPAAPLAGGRIVGEGLSLALVEQGLHLSGGELLAEFDRDRLHLARLEFVSPNRVRPRDGRVPVDRLTREPGRLSATGEIALDSGAGRFRFDAERLPILQRSDRWLILSGAGTATSTWTSADLTAELRADAGFIETADTPPPSLSDDVVILGRVERPAGDGFKVAADIGVALGDHFYLSALGVDTRLTGSLRLRLRDGQPLSAVGSIATAGGSYRGYGQRLSIERGLINFQGALDNPGLNVVTLRKGLAVEAGLEIAGSARRPRIRLVSQPNVPDPEKLSWIVLGRAPSAGAGADLGLLLPAAQALLGGPGGGMTEQLSRSLGFDELSIGQGELGGVTRSATSRVVGDGTIVSGGDGVGAQVLTLGKRLSSDLFLSFEQSLGGAESLVKLTYQLTRRVSLVARGGSDNSADIYYTISFE
jgi:translocation and assembly module TamB